MSQQHEQSYVGLPPEGSRISYQSFKAMQTGIIIHDATQNDLINTGVIVHDADVQRDGEADRDTQPNQPAILSWLSALWCWFSDISSRPPELQIRQRRDRHGNLWWHVYDPITNHSVRLSSEAEVRVWIEQSYQRRFR